MVVTAAELGAWHPAGRDRHRHLRVVRRVPRPGRSVGADGQLPRPSAGAVGTASEVRTGVCAGLRMLAAAVLSVLALGLGGWLGSVSAGVASDAAARPTDVERTVVVGPGETIWDVALVQAPAAVDAYAQRVLALNGLEAGRVRSGTVLQLPSG